MGKISQVSAKYIINASIQIEGVVDRPDVIGAIFGQTEGLLGADLELRELQRSGRIGRIEVNVETRVGKSQGNIVIPSSLDKAETSIVAAALEIIQRIGPCNAKIKVLNIEDVRISKRKYVIERAKELLKNMMDGVMPDSQELADEVSYSVRTMEIQEYGPERLPSGPSIDDSDEIIVVEGRADVLNLLKYGFKNAIALNGTSAPQTVLDLCRKKTVTLFVDGDRGGDLIIKELTGATEIDFITKAPDGKEVEEITQKEIHKALRARVPADQIRIELPKRPMGAPSEQTIRHDVRTEMRSEVRPSVSGVVSQQAPVRRFAPSQPLIRSVMPIRKPSVTDAEKKTYKEIMEDLVGTKGAYILDDQLNILGKVPISELQTTVKSLGSGINAIVLDGSVDKDLVKTAEMTSVKSIVGTDLKIKSSETKINLISVDEL